MDSLVKEGSIGSVLFKSQIINEEDLKAALDEQKISGCRIGEALVKLGIVTQEDIDWALSNQLNIPYVRLNQDTIDKAAVEMVPEALARKFDLIPIYRTADEIIIALADPLNKAAIEAVKKVTGCRVTVSMPIIRELREMQDIFYGPVEMENVFGFSSSLFPANIIEEINKDLSGSTFLNNMLLYITRSNLFSLSFQPLGDIVAVTGKQGDISREIGRLTVDYYPDLLLKIKKLGRLNGLTDICAEGILEYQYNGEIIYFQVFTLKGKGGDYVTLKMRPDLHFPTGIDDLALSPGNLHSFGELVAVRQGIVLFCSSSRDECCRIIDLYLDEIDTAEKTVMVLGDGPGRGKKRFPSISLQKMLPIEMESLATALLDHDPDIVVVEDVSESHLFKLAAKAAMRGKLAVCGFSCGDAAGTLEYFRYARLDYPVFPHIKGIVSVKGTRLLCPLCKKNYVPSVGAVAVIPVSIPAASWFAPHGCSACGYTGYQGIRYLMDVILFNDEILTRFAAVRENGEILQHLRGNGYHGILDKEIELLAAGEISLEDYLTSVKR
jgi:type II secretory ATPase GspE/PulE/Tfp pilus assembly ATPase PilB-like protein